MGPVINSSIEYTCGDARLIGYLSEPQAQNCPAIVLVHDAFGVGDYIKGIAQKLADLGYVTLAADVWGDGRQLYAEADIGPMIGRLASNRQAWMARLSAARETVLSRPSADPQRVAIVGYCFGGASALEYLRTVGDVRGAVSVHGGLDLIGEEWAAMPGSRKALLLTGFEDPMAAIPTLQALQASMNIAGVDWETNLYGQTRHGFTRPDSDRANKPNVIAYQAQSDKRAWAAMSRFLDELFST